MYLNCEESVIVCCNLCWFVSVDQNLVESELGSLEIVWSAGFVFISDCC